MPLCCFGAKQGREKEEKQEKTAEMAALVEGKEKLWVVRRAPKPDAKVRMFLLPWAGGNSTAYTGWQATLPEEVEVCAIELPGRMSRARETCYTSVKDTARDCVEALKRLGLLDDKPFVLFGYSMGSRIAFEMTRLLQRKEWPAPVVLCVAASEPPQMSEGLTAAHLPRDELIAHLVDMGGLSEEVAAHKALMDMFLPTIQADYTMLDVYRLSDPSEKVTCAMVAYGGETDPGVPLSSLQRWRENASGSFEHKLFPGGHFFVKDPTSHAALMAHLVNLLSSHLS